MTIPEDSLKLIKSQVNALLTYSNGVTGNNDAKLGDAIRTLANGFGSGGSSPFIPQKNVGKIVTLDGNQTTLDLSDLYSVTNMGQIIGVRIDGLGLETSNGQTDYSAHSFYYYKSNNSVRYHYTSSSNGLMSGNGSATYIMPSGTNGIFTLGTYGKKAMKGAWYFIAIR